MAEKLSALDLVQRAQAKARDVRDGEISIDGLIRTIDQLAEMLIAERARVEIQDESPRERRPVEDLLREFFPEKSEAEIKQMADEMRRIALGGDVADPDKVGDTEEWQRWRDEAEKKKKDKDDD
jgi:hypothetical protein